MTDRTEGETMLIRIGDEGWINPDHIVAVDDDGSTVTVRNIVGGEYVLFKNDPAWEKMRAILDIGAVDQGFDMLSSFRKEMK